MISSTNKKDCLMRSNYWCFSKNLLRSTLDWKEKRLNLNRERNKSSRTCLLERRPKRLKKERGRRKCKILRLLDGLTASKWKFSRYHSYSNRKLSLKKRSKLKINLTQLDSLLRFKIKFNKKLIQLIKLNKSIKKTACLKEIRSKEKRMTNLLLYRRKNRQKWLKTVKQTHKKKNRKSRDF